MDIKTDTKEKPVGTIFQVASEAPNISWQDAALVDPKAVALLLYAQSHYPDRYRAFVEGLARDNIPWSFNDSGFLYQLNKFYIELYNEGVSEKEVDRAIPKDMLDTF